MKHVLDVSTLNTYSSGAKQRFLNLYSELVKNNKNKKFEIIYTTFDQVKIFFKFSNVSFKKNPINQDSSLKKIISIFNIFLYIKNRLKKVHSVEYFTLPFIKINNCRTIFTIHDLRRIYFAKSFFKRIALKLFFKFFIFQAEKIIVVSKSIEHEIKKYFGNLNISVVYNTINLIDYKNIKSKDTLLIKKKYNLKKNFILSVGHLENRKNYLRLIKSINILHQNNFDINMVIIGQKADETKKIKRLIKKLNLSSKIKVLSNLNDYEVKCFYKLTSLFVFPSIYEGFGIPILESMASNKPMVLSNTKIFREITENKYIYFDQFDPHSIANKIKFVLENKKMQKDMISYGKKRVNYFSLNNQKQNLIKLYNNI